MRKVENGNSKEDSQVWLSYKRYPIHDQGASIIHETIFNSDKIEKSPETNFAWPAG